MGRKPNITVSLREVLRTTKQSLILAGILLFGFSLPAAASYMPFNTSVNMNIGIGTSTPQGAFVVVNGNVGIGTWAPGGSLIVQGGNVGIGTYAPSALFTVNGSSVLGVPLSSTDSIISSGQGSLAGGDATHGLGNFGSISSSGDGTFAFGFTQGSGLGIGSITSSGFGAIAMGAAIAGGTIQSSSGIAMGQATAGGTIEATASGAIALGSATGGTLAASGSSSVAIGFNVQATAFDSFAIGGGVVNPNINSFMVGFNATPTLTVTGTGVGIGTSSPFGGGLIVLPANTGNVGIGSLTPGQALDVAGTVRMTGLTLTGNGASNGYVMVGNSVGVGTWMSASTLATAAGNSSNYWLNDNGNVGINTTYNVGIGTTAQVNTLNILGNIGIGTFSYDPYMTRAAPNGGMIISGNVGIGTWLPGGGLVVMNGNVGVGVTSPQGPLHVANGVSYFGTGGYGDAGTLYINPNYGAYFEIPAGVVLGSQSTGGISILPGGQGGLAGTKAVIAYFNQTSWHSGLEIANVASGYGNLLLMRSGGNVGIGSVTPGQALDVTGTVRAIGFTMSGNTPVSGYVLTANDSSGDVTWSPSGAVGGWTVSGNNVYETSNGNVGIGTFNPFGGGLIVLPANTGNVGIGSLTPGQALDVQGTVRMTGLTLNLSPGAGYVIVGNGVGVGTWMAPGTLPGAISGLTTNFVTKASSASTLINSLIFDNGTNVGIGSANPNAALDISGTLAVEGVGSSYFSNNVGIGSLAPGQALDVQGTARMTGLTLTGNGASNGYVMVGNSVGVGTWMSASTLATAAGNSSNYWLNDNGNVGINTTYNIGIGTISQVNTLNILGNIGIGTFSYDPYMLTQAPNGGMIISGNVGIGTWLPIDVLSIGTAPVASATHALVNLSNTALSSGNTNGTYIGANPASYSGDFFDFQIGGVDYVRANNVGGGQIYVGPSATGIEISDSGISQTGVLNNGSAVSWINIFNNEGAWTDTGNYKQNYVSVHPTYDPSGPVSSSMQLVNFSSVPTISNADSITATSTAQWVSIEAGGSFGYNTGDTYNGTNPMVGVLIDPTINVSTASTGGYTALLVNPQVTSAPGGTNLLANFQLGGISKAVITAAGNVGIGSISPGQKLDVQGTVRAIGFTMSGQTPISGYVLTASDSSGDTTWSSPGTVGGWTTSGNNVYETSNGNVGIGTTNPFGGNLIVNGGGNVGIGSLVPGQMLDVKGTVRDIGQIVNGNVGIGTSALQTAFAVTNGNVGIGTWTAVGGALIVSNGVGNVGIGSLTPGQLLDVKGTVRDIGEIVNGNVGIGTSALQTAFAVTNGNVGIGTWTAAGGALIVSNGVGNVGIGSLTPGQLLDVQGTVRGLGQIVNGNVGIGTSALQTAFAVANGNVGIGTWSAGGGNLIVNGGGNVGIGSAWPGQVLDVQGNIRDTGEIVNGNVGIGTSASQTAFAVANGNVGIGTWTAGGGNLIINGGGNVGIGSAWPGTALDVQGTVRMTGFTLTGNGAAPGSVMVTNSIGLGTWMPINTIAAAGAITSEVANEIAYYVSPSLSQTMVGSSSMVFIAPNVGLGTVTPLATLQVVGNIGIGTVSNGDNFIANSPTKGGMIIEGNVGIGTWIPAGQLDVEGTLSVTYLKGNVGIGTATVPAYNLDLVNGTSRSRPVRRTVSFPETVSVSLTINSNITDVAEVSGFNNAGGITLTFANPSPSTPNDGDFLEMRVKDGGTAITIAYGASFASTTTTMPLTTVASTWLRILFEYNSTSGLWECVAST